MELSQKSTGSTLKLLPAKIAYQQQIQLNTTNFYDTIVKLCQYENLDVISFTTSDKPEATPRIPLLTELF